MDGRAAGCDGAWESTGRWLVLIAACFLFLGAGCATVLWVWAWIGYPESWPIDIGPITLFLSLAAAAVILLWRGVRSLTRGLPPPSGWRRGQS